MAWKTKEFVVQLANIYKNARLICYLRFVNKKQLIEDLFFGKDIAGKTSFEIVEIMTANQIN